MFRINSLTALERSIIIPWQLVSFGAESNTTNSLETLFLLFRHFAGS